MGESMRVETIGDATLYLDDCMNILPTLQADAVITDPPYGTGFYEADKDAGVEWMRRFERVAMFGYPELLVGWCMKYGKQPDEWLTWWPTNAALKTASRTAHIARESECIAIWGKTVAPLKRPRTDEGAALALTNGHSVDKSCAIIGDVWRDASPGLGFNCHQRRHPNEKPFSLMVSLIWLLTKHGETVLDPFMGSGTTGAACVSNGRKFVGVEIDPAHFDTACERIASAQSQGRLFA